MKHVLLLLSLTQCYLSTAQESPLVPTRPNAYTTDSLRTGDWVFFFDINRQNVPKWEDAQYYQFITYVDGKSTGEVNNYYRSGELEQSANMVEGRYEGAKTVFSRPGNVVNYEFYENDKVNYQRSIQQFESIVEGSSNLAENQTDYVSAFNNLVLLVRKSGRFKDLERILSKGKEVQRKTLGEKHPVYAKTLAMLADLYTTIGRYAESESLWVEAMEISVDSHQQYLQGLIYTYIKMGRYGIAESLFPKVENLILDQFGKDHIAYAHFMQRKGAFYFETGRYDETELATLKALEIAKELTGENNPFYGLTLNNLGLMYTKWGRYEEAEPLHLRAHEIIKKNIGTNIPEYSNSLYSLANFYLASGKGASLAEEYYQQALKIDEQVYGKVSKEVVKGKRWYACFSYKQQRKLKAISLFIEVLDFYESFLEDSFDQLGESERAAFYSTLHDDFEQFKEFALREATEYPELGVRAYSTQLRHKAILLNTSNQIKRRIMSSGDRKLIALFDEVQALKQLIGQVQGLTLAEQKAQGVQIEGLKKELHKKDLQLTGLSTFYSAQNKHPTWQDVRSKLSKREAAIEIVRYREYDYQKLEFTDKVHYAAFIVTSKSKNGPEIIRFSDGNFLEEKAIRGYTNAIHYQLQDEHSYNYFWTPLKRALKNIDKVYLSPDGVFHQLNPSTLYNTEKERFLSEEMNIQLVTSSRDILSEERERLPNQYALLLGNPDFGYALDSLNKHQIQQNSEIEQLLVARNRNGLDPLPGTEREVMEIDKILESNQWRKQVLLGPFATESALKDMLKPKVLHIATHGFFKEDVQGKFSYFNNPLYRSGIFLSGASKTVAQIESGSLRGNVELGKEDGILTAFEAMNLNIDNTDLVVLSACETGLGEIKNGEGVYGLQRAFQVAGARSILMSLWKVNDQTTQELMVSFYENWLGGMTKREGFDKAKEQLKIKYPHPYYWGAFVLVGE